jgi:hypothetical protein
MEIVTVGSFGRRPDVPLRAFGASILSERMAKKTTGKAQETNIAPGGTNGNANERSESTGATGATRESGFSNEEIAARAYEIYEREGRSDGRAMDHWLQAENELQAERQNRGINPQSRQEAPRSARQHQQSPGV